jgi:hypothetical protein
MDAEEDYRDQASEHRPSDPIFHLKCSGVRFFDSDLQRTLIYRTKPIERLTQCSRVVRDRCILKKDDTGPTFSGPTQKIYFIRVIVATCLHHDQKGY